MPSFLVREPRQTLLVTLGIGNDIDAEKHCLQQYRDYLRVEEPIEFIGAEPAIASAKVYGEIGSYYLVAVAADSNVRLGFVRDRPGQRGSYSRQLVSDSLPILSRDAVADTCS